MKIIVEDSYETMSKRAAIDIGNTMTSISQPLFCVASGDSPKGLYKELARQQNASSLDTSQWYFLGLDEWIGLGRNDEGSCRFMLNEDVFKPLHVSEEKICCFEGKASNTDNECERIETLINKHGGIDVAILGIGMNGHVGLNEPGTSPTSRSHVCEVDAVTKKVGQKYFSRPQNLTQGITLGIATLMDAKHLILIVSGEKKAAILQQALEGEVTDKIPASLIRKHPDFYVYADEDAAKLLTKTS